MAGGACLFTSKLIGHQVSKKTNHRFFRIIELRKNSRKIFEFKALIFKIFQNKDLPCQRALKIGLGAASRAALVDGAPLATPFRFPSSHTAGRESVMGHTEDL
jgi:hypothetical protein